MGQESETTKPISKKGTIMYNDIVLEKSIFSNIFDKDIRRAFIYKKTERLAKAIHLITPAFTDSMSLKARIETIALGLIEAATRPPNRARTILSRELLLLSSILSVARTSHSLSQMNVDLISDEAQSLLAELASYEEPRLSLEAMPTLPTLARNVTSKPRDNRSVSRFVSEKERGGTSPIKGISAHKGTDDHKGHIKDRRTAILSVLRDKGSVGIKDISVLIKDVSEKTIQRELSALIAEGVVSRKGERRWSLYSLAR